MSRASLREVAQATLGAWTAWLRKVPNSPFRYREMAGGGSLDSHLGGTHTLILPGRIGPATREPAWKRSASASSHDGPAFH